MKTIVRQIAFRAEDSTTEDLPQYEGDERALSKAQLNQIKKIAPKAKGGNLRTSLFDAGHHQNSRDRLHSNQQKH